MICHRRNSTHRHRQAGPRVIITTPGPCTTGKWSVCWRHSEKEHSPRGQLRTPATDTPAQIPGDLHESNRLGLAAAVGSGR